MSEMNESKSEREILLDVLMAARLFLAVKSTPKNPFVKSFGRDERLAEQESFKLLQECVDDASFLFPELESIEEETFKKEMSCIDAEEESFDRDNA
jgi:hypothetical protein